MAEPIEPVTSLSCAPTKQTPGEETYECHYCGETHSKADWLHFEDNYDGAPSETDTMGYEPTDRAALRDAGRRVR